jgi:hypothetical protein
VDLGRRLRGRGVMIDRLSIRIRPPGWLVMYQTWGTLLFLHERGNDTSPALSRGQEPVWPLHTLLPHRSTPTRVPVLQARR